MYGTSKQLIRNITTGQLRLRDGISYHGDNEQFIPVDPSNKAAMPGADPTWPGSMELCRAEKTHFIKTPHSIKD